VLNGLDIPVTVEITADGGDRQSLEVAAHGRATPEVSGMATVKVTTSHGDLISENKAQFGRPTGCKHIYSVMGAAAYVSEDVQYGTGFGTPTSDVGTGELTEEECGVSFAFIDPPRAVTADQYGPSGKNLRWLHYHGDGGWLVAVHELLDDHGPYASQRHGEAQRIVAAVVTHDPTNPGLAEVKRRLTQMGLVVPAAQQGNLLADSERR
jgi:hypothetical protein